MQGRVRGWEGELEGLHERLGKLFKRPESRQRALAYLRGLLSRVERKNSWQLAEWIGEASPDGVQHLLERAQWDADAARDVLREYVIETLGADAGRRGAVWLDHGRRSVRWGSALADGAGVARPSVRDGDCQGRAAVVAGAAVQACR